MRAISHAKIVAGLSLLGVIAAASSCSSTPTRRATTELSTEPALTAFSEGIVAPVVLTSTVPEYPYPLRKQGVIGRVDVSCLIGKDGRVQDVQVVNSDGDDFAEAAIDAVKKWTFKPGTQNGEPVPMRVTIPVNFSLVD